jgi:putative inorganic carbon (hco3(-)) transporter
MSVPYRSVPPEPGAATSGGLIWTTPPRPTQAGRLVWSSALVVACFAYGAAIVTGRVDVFLAFGIALAIPLVFAVNLEAGVLSLILLRPSLDTFADSSIGSLGGQRLNPASLMAIVTIAIAVPYMIEQRRRLMAAPSILPYAAFAVVAASGILVSPDPGTSATEWVRLVAIMVTYALVYVSTRSRAQVGRVLVAVVLSGLIPAAAGIGQYVWGGQRTIGDYSRLTGTFVHPDPYGIYLALVLTVGMTVILARASWDRWLVAPALLILIAALVGSYTRTAWVIAGIAVLVLGAARFRRLLLLAPLLVAAVILAVPSTTTRFNDISTPRTNPYGSGNSFNSRVTQWRDALPKAERRPLTGLGLTAIVDESQYSQHVHSDYVRTLVETGVFGFISYVWLLLATLIGCVKTIRAAGRESVWPLAAAGLAGLAVATCYLVASGDSNLITQSAVSGTAWAIFACAHAAGRIARDELDPPPPSRHAARREVLFNAPGIRVARVAHRR